MSLFSSHDHYNSRWIHEQTSGVWYPHASHHTHSNHGCSYVIFPIGRYQVTLITLRRFLDKLIKRVLFHKIISKGWILQAASHKNGLCLHWSNNPGLSSSRLIDNHEWRIHGQSTVRAMVNQCYTSTFSHIYENIVFNVKNVCLTKSAEMSIFRRYFFFF